MSTLNVVGGSGGITTAGSGNTITISMSGGPSSPFKVTDFDSSGTWTIDPTTVAVTIFLWCGGGGGSHGTSGLTSAGGGGGAGNFYLREMVPAATFNPAGESIVIGAGGAGCPYGAHQLYASPGGVSSVGTFLVPAAQSNEAYGFYGGPPPLLDYGNGQILYGSSSGGKGGYSGVPGLSSQDSTATGGQRNRGFGATGGAGAGWSSLTNGSSGNIKTPSGTVLVSGVSSIGANGNDGVIYQGYLTGGTGGAVGEGYPHSTYLTGGTGGVPGGGGGAAGYPHGSTFEEAGTGGAGYVIIWEYN